MIVNYSYPKNGIEEIVQTFQTSVKFEVGLRPVWNQVFEIPLRKSITKGAISFFLWEKDVTYDDFIGYSKLSVQELIAKPLKGNKCIEV